MADLLLPPTLSTPRLPPLAGEQVTDSTRNIGATLSSLALVLGIAKEYGLNIGRYLDPQWQAFLMDPRILIMVTSAALWAGNVWRKSRLRRMVVHELDRLEGETLPPP